MPCPRIGRQPLRQPLQRLLVPRGGLRIAGQARRTAGPLAAMHTFSAGNSTPRSFKPSSRSTESCARLHSRLPTSAGSAKFRHESRLISAPSPLAVAGRRLFSTTRASQTFSQPLRHLPDLEKVVGLVTDAKDRLFSNPAIPSEEETATALRICAEAADLIMDAAVQPQLSSIDHQSDTAASALLSMDRKRRTAATGTGEAGQEEDDDVVDHDVDGEQRRRTAPTVSRAKSTAAETEETTDKSADALPLRFRGVVTRISDTAFDIVENPRVAITPALLEQYVSIQSRLNRSETLPRVLELYVTKAVPKQTGDTIEYVPPKYPGKPSNAVPVTVAEAALDTALAAKNIDAAVGIIEFTYASPAFVRNKMVRKGLLPAFVVFGVPLATYSMAGRLAQMQTTMDDAMFTNVAFAAIMVYIVCTGTIGVVSNATANDQMRRVTWAPGTPLRERWLREEERAAFDKVACAFGFTDELRYGEEEGPEFQALREYIMRKGMLVDQTELLEGMSE